MFAQPINERQNRVDWILLTALAGLMVMGVAFIYSATMANESTTHLAWFRQPHFKQLVWYAVGLGCAGAICLVDYRILSRWAMVGYWITILLLVAVLIPQIGTWR